MRGKSNSLLIYIEIDGKKIQCEVDSDACFTVISSKQFISNYGKRNLKPLNNKLKFIDGSTVNVLGYALTKVQKLDVPKEIHNLPLVVIDSDFEFIPLLGRNWLDALYKDWRTMFLNFKQNCYQVNSIF